uniref:Uncharacterized protein n=1 Tax=Rhabditophanes sp. KR3021 TaxID=114890 RepID=A0AC35TFJ7_9BILA
MMPTLTDTAPATPVTLPDNMSRISMKPRTTDTAPATPINSRQMPEYNSRTITKPMGGGQRILQTVSTDPTDQKHIPTRVNRNPPTPIGPLGPQLTREELEARLLIILNTMPPCEFVDATLKLMREEAEKIVTPIISEFNIVCNLNLATAAQFDEMSETILRGNVLVEKKCGDEKEVVTQGMINAAMAKYDELQKKIEVYKKINNQGNALIESERKNGHELVKVINKYKEHKAAIEAHINYISHYYTDCKAACKDVVSETDQQIAFIAAETSNNLFTLNAQNKKNDLMISDLTAQIEQAEDQGRRLNEIIDTLIARSDSYGNESNA